MEQSRTPDICPLVAEFGSPISAAEQEMKQRRTSYLLATDQRRNPREEYFASRQAPEQQKSDTYSYDLSAKSRFVIPKRLRST